MAGIPDKAVIPLAKICWASSTNNTTEDIVNMIKACNKEQTSYILWYYSWIFHSNNHQYNPDYIRLTLSDQNTELPAYINRDQDLPQRNKDSIDESKLDQLILEMSNPSPGSPRFAAFQEVIKIGKPAVSRLIKEMETSGNWQIPKALGAIGDSRAILPLKIKLKNNNFSPMREVLIEAIEAITGQKVNDSSLPKTVSPIRKEASQHQKSPKKTSPRRNKRSRNQGHDVPPKLTFPHEEKNFEPLPWPHQPPDLNASQIEKVNRDIWVINDFPLYQADEAGNWRYIHGGFDIVLDNGTKIYAMKDGWVKAINSSSIVIANSKDNSPSYGWDYTHLGNFQVNVGDFVRKGAYIGQIKFKGLAHIHLDKVFSEGSHWGNWHYICMPNPHFTCIDEEPPVIKSPFYLCRNNTNKMIRPGEGKKMTVGGNVDIVIGIRDGGQYARSNKTGFGDRLGIARIEYEISCVENNKSPSHKFTSFDFSELKFKKGFSARKYATKLTKIIYKHWKRFETNRHSGDKVFCYYIITNCPKKESPKELAFHDRNLCWETALLDEQGKPAFPNGKYDIAVTVYDYAGNKSTEVMQVIVANQS